MWRHWSTQGHLGLHNLSRFSYNFAHSHSSILFGLVSRRTVTETSYSKTHEWVCESVISYIENLLEAGGNITLPSHQRKWAITSQRTSKRQRASVRNIHVNGYTRFLHINSVTRVNQTQRWITPNSRCSYIICWKFLFCWFVHSTTHSKFKFWGAPTAWIILS